MLVKPKYTSEESTPLRFLKFLKVALPILVVVRLVFFISLFSAKYGAYSRLYYVANFALVLAATVWLNKMDWKGVLAFCGIFVLQFVDGAISLLLLASSGFAVSPWRAIGAMLGALVIPALVIVYFDKRRLLFTPLPKKKTFKPAIPKELYAQQEQQTARWYTCPKCGQLVREGEDCDCEAMKDAISERGKDFGAKTDRTLEDNVMSLKGSELTSEMVTLYEMKDAWYNHDPTKYGRAGTQTEEDAFPLFLCRHINSLRKQIASHVSLANKWRIERNLAFTFSAVFLILSLVFAFRPIALSSATDNSNDATQWKQQQEVERDNDGAGGGLTLTDTRTGQTWKGNVPEPVLTPEAVYNGKIITRPNGEQLAPLSIYTKGDKNFYVILDGDDRMSFYAAADSVAEVEVPLGNYEIYYATGDTWYGKKDLFGQDTTYHKCEGDFEFYEDGDYYQGWTLELFLQRDGNMSTETITADEFPV